MTSVTAPSLHSETGDCVPWSTDSSLQKTCSNILHESHSEIDYGVNAQWHGGWPSFFADTFTRGLRIIAASHLSIEPYLCFHRLSFKPKQLVHNIHFSGKNVFSTFFLFLIKSLKNEVCINMCVMFLRNNVCHLTKCGEILSEQVYLKEGWDILYQCLYKSHASERVGGRILVLWHSQYPHWDPRVSWWFSCLSK